MCCALFRNPAHYLGMYTIKEGTLNAVNTVALGDRELDVRRSGLIRLTPRTFVMIYPVVEVKSTLPMLLG